jgi:hypothetical protein
VKNLAHSASLHSRENIAPSKSGIKHLVKRPVPAPGWELLRPTGHCEVCPRGIFIRNLHKVPKYFYRRSKAQSKIGILAIMGLLIAVTPIPTASGGAFELGTPRNPAASSCASYDLSCQRRERVFRPHLSRDEDVPPPKYQQKLLLPRDLNARSGNTLLLNDPTYGLPSKYSNLVVDCLSARSYFRSKGYKKIRTIHCGGKYHQFNAERFGRKYLLKMTARTGHVEVRQRLK